MKIRMSKGDRLFTGVIGVVLTFFFIITLYPMVYVVSASFSSPAAVASGRMWLWPVETTLEGYKFIFAYKELWNGYANTILYTVVGTTIALVLTIPCAYALSRRDMKGRGVVLAYFMITMYISGGMIPSYLNIMELGLLDTRLYMFLTGAFSVYNMIVARSFFSGLPWELHEAAYLDGASDFTTFTRIVLPLSKPIIVVMMLYYAVGKWNEYFTAMIYLRDRDLFPLQLILKEILVSSQVTGMSLEGLSAEDMAAVMNQQDTSNLLKYGIIVVSSLPMMILYPLVQKFFEKGVMIGSVKG